MADINLMPPYARVKDGFTGTMTVATGKRGMIVVADGATHDGVKISTAAGETAIMGVIASQGDPNNSDLFATGDRVTVQTDGDAEVLFPAGTVIAREDIIIASGTAGMAKVLGAEGKPYVILGRAKQAITIGAAAGLASVRLAIEYVPA